MATIPTQLRICQAPARCSIANGFPTLERFGLRASKFIEERVHHDNIAYRTDSVAGAAAAVVAGLGMGYLPCMVGDITPGLIRVGAVEPALDDELWLLTHPDIRKSGRIYAFMTHCVQAIRRQRELAEGCRETISGPPEIDSSIALFDALRP